MSRVQRSRDPMRRRKILDAAKRSFTAHGLKNTNLEAVAAEAGCSKGALYLEFADKEALLREVVNEAFTAVRARFEAEVVAIPSPLERLVELLRFAFREFAAEPLFGRLLRDDPDLRALVATEGDAERRRAADAERARLQGWVDEGIRLGEIREDLDREALPMVIGLLRFAPEHLGIVTSIGGFSGERTLAAIADIFRAGIAAPARDARRGARSSPRRAPPAKSSNRGGRGHGR